jgi:Protein of unknown function (DUF1566)
MNKFNFFLIILFLILGCSKSEPAPTQLFKIGDSKFGGKIFYIDNTGLHGLVAAPSDQSDSITWDNGFGTDFITGATDTTIGTGSKNTARIISILGTGNYAASICKNLSLNGYSDWYLPSRDELNQLFINVNSIGGFVHDDEYWSSSESISLESWAKPFNIGYELPLPKYEAHSVRAVRSF